MAIGMCARCYKRKDCRQLQPGTWVIDCDLFKPDPKAMRMIMQSSSATNIASREKSRTAHNEKRRRKETGLYEQGISES
jgi:hypothetical protein